MPSSPYGARIDQLVFEHHDDSDKALELLQEEASRKGDLVWARCIEFINDTRWTEERTNDLLEFISTLEKSQIPPGELAEILPRLLICEALARRTANPEKSRTALDRARSLARSPVLRAKTLRARMFVLEAQGAHGAVLETAKELRKDLKGNAPIEKSLILDSYLLELPSLETQKRWSDYLLACEQIEELAAKFPQRQKNLVWTMHAKTSILENQGRFEECCTALSRLLDHLQNTPGQQQLLFRSQLRWCRCQIEMGDINAAERQLQELRKTTPPPAQFTYREDPTAQEQNALRFSMLQFNLALLFVRKGDPAKAQLACEAAIDALQRCDDADPFSGPRLAAISLKATLLLKHDVESFIPFCTIIHETFNQYRSSNSRKKFLKMLFRQARHCRELRLFPQEAAILVMISTHAGQEEDQELAIEVLLNTIDCVLALTEQGAWMEASEVLGRVEQTLSSRPGVFTETVQISSLYCGALVDHHFGRRIEAFHKIGQVMRYPSTHPEVRRISLEGSLAESRWWHEENDTTRAESTLKEALSRFKDDISPPAQTARAKLLVAYADLVLPPVAFAELRRFIRLRHARKQAEAKDNDLTRSTLAVQAKLDEISAHMSTSERLLAHLKNLWFEG